MSTKTAPAPATIADLVRLAVKRGKHTFTLEHSTWSGYTLKATGGRGYSAYNITLAPDVGEALAQQWKKRGSLQFSFVGQRTIAGVLALLGDTTDVKALIKAAEKAEAARRETIRRADQRIRAVVALDAALATLRIVDAAGNHTPLCFVQGTAPNPVPARTTMTLLRDQLTRNDPAAAHAIAFTTFGAARDDD